MAAVLPLAAVSSSFTSSQGELYYGLAKAVDVSGAGSGSEEDPAKYRVRRGFFGGEGG